jgi:hypothetical protein
MLCWGGGLGRDRRQRIQCYAARYEPLGDEDKVYSWIKTVDGGQQARRPSPGHTFLTGPGIGAGRHLGIAQNTWAIPKWCPAPYRGSRLNHQPYPRIHRHRVTAVEL